MTVMMKKSLNWRRWMNDCDHNDHPIHILFVVHHQASIFACFAEKSNDTHDGIKWQMHLCIVNASLHGCRQKKWKCLKSCWSACNLINFCMHHINWFCQHTTDPLESHWNLNVISSAFHLHLIGSVVHFLVVSWVSHWHLIAISWGSNWQLICMLLVFHGLMLSVSVEKLNETVIAPHQKWFCGFFEFQRISMH